jgi:hypothetical protein
MGANAAEKTRRLTTVAYRLEKWIRSIPKLEPALVSLLSN